VPLRSSPYRDGRDALRLRFVDLLSRLEEIDEQLEPHMGGLSATLRARLTSMRRAAAPSNGSAEELVRAERAAVALEREVDEALGLAADLQRAVDSMLPSAVTLARWAGLATLASVLLVVSVVQAGLGDFMLQAFGVKVLRANAALPCDRFSFEAERAARGGEAPEHAEWVDPEPQRSMGRE
jgi:hypothetical protein